MVGFDDAAMMGLGAINAGVQIAGAQQQKRGQKKLERIGREGQKRNYEYQLKNLNLEQEDVNRRGALAQQESRESDADRGMLNSSQRDYNRNQLEGERSRRFDALERQKQMLNADWLDNERSYKIQKKMQKNAETMNMISTFLQQGASGIKEAKSGSPLGADGSRHAF